MPHVLGRVGASPYSDPVVQRHQTLFWDVPLCKKALSALRQLGLTDDHPLGLPGVGQSAVDGDRELGRMLVAEDASGGLGESGHQHTVLLFKTAQFTESRRHENVVLELAPSMQSEVTHN